MDQEVALSLSLITHSLLIHIEYICILILECGRMTFRVSPIAVAVDFVCAFWDVTIFVDVQCVLKSHIR